MSNRFISISSGSSGNCYYVKNQTSGNAILLEAGVTLSKVRKTLKAHGEDLSSIKAIVVSHAHNDHVRNLHVLCSHLNLVVYMEESVRNSLHPGTLEDTMPFIKTFRYGDVLRIADFTLETFPVPHDVPNTGYFVTNADGELNMAFITDIGVTTPEAEYAASRATSLIIEADYDLDMLLRGNYAPELKERITQGHGHFSNADCAAFLKNIWHDRLRYIFLCHISGNNNTPSLAYEHIRGALKETIGDANVTIAPLPRLQALSYNI